MGSSANNHNLEDLSQSFRGNVNNILITINVWGGVLGSLVSAQRASSFQGWLLKEKENWERNDCRGTMKSYTSSWMKLGFASQHGNWVLYLFPMLANMFDLDYYGSIWWVGQNMCWRFSITFLINDFCTLYSWFFIFKSYFSSVWRAKTAKRSSHRKKCKGVWEFLQWRALAFLFSLPKKLLIYTSLYFFWFWNLMHFYYGLISHNFFAYLWFLS